MNYYPPPPRRPPSKPRRPWLIGAIAVLAACLLAVIALAAHQFGSSGSAVPIGVQPSAATGADAGAVPPVPAGFTQVFLDNFGGPQGSPPSALNWMYDIGAGWDNKQVEHDTNSTSNVYLDGKGDLVIQANESNGEWTSGRIETTRDDFAAPPGGKLEMTASVQQPNVADSTGYWPAFWALGSPMRTGGKWPKSGEIDMFEAVNNMDRASQTLHDGGATFAHGPRPCPATACADGFNTYSVIIDRTNPGAESLEFLMDGQVMKTVTEAQVGTGVWQAAIDHGFFIILNLAMGGHFPNAVCKCITPTAATTPGGQLKVAYVAVYERGGDSTPVAKATAAGQVTGYQNNCLSVLNSVNRMDSHTLLGACDSSDGQYWSTYSDGTLRALGGCLDVSASKRAAGTAVVWYPCTGANSQVWQPQAGGELYNPHSGLCLTSPGNAARLDITPCTGAPQQQWHLPG
jgi:beta-glucanase (GH16 family)